MSRLCRSTIDVQRPNHRYTNECAILGINPLTTENDIVNGWEGFVANEAAVERCPRPLFIPASTVMSISSLNWPEGFSLVNAGHYDGVGDGLKANRTNIDGGVDDQCRAAAVGLVTIASCGGPNTDNGNLPLLQRLSAVGIHDGLSDINNFSHVTEGQITRSGSINRALRFWQVKTGTTAGSTAETHMLNDFLPSRGKARNVIPWRNEIILHITFSVIEGTTNGIGRLTLGKLVRDPFAELARPGIGIQVEDTTLYGMAHDGTTMDKVSLATLVEDQTYTITITSDGSGNIEWFVDMVSKGTSAGGPTGDSTPGASTYRLEAENGIDAAAQHIRVAATMMYIER